MISSLALGYRILGTVRHRDAAINAAEFIVKEMQNSGALLRIFCKGTAKQPGFLDDYAFFITSLIDLYETTFDLKWICETEKLTNLLIEKFWDEKNGCFFFTSPSHTNLITRTKPTCDGSIPSGNSAAAYALLRLAKLLDNRDYYTRAEKILNIFSREIQQVPLGYMAMLNAGDFYCNLPLEIAFAGQKNSKELKKLLSALYSEFVPNKVVAYINTDDANKLSIRQKIPLLRNKSTIEGKAAVYVCKDYTCQQPVTEPEELIHLISVNGGKLQEG
jgi:uncharacterized protein YyaL (SSP411 family)